MSLAKKLNFKPGQTVEVHARPEGVDLGDVEIVESGATGGVITFARTLAEVGGLIGPVREALTANQIAWILYPKAGKLGTDLNRDVLWRHLGLSHGLTGVRQVAIDDIWSAMRFKLADESANP